MWLELLNPLCLSPASRRALEREFKAQCWDHGELGSGYRHAGQSAQGRRSSVKRFLILPKAEHCGLLPAAWRVAMGSELCALVGMEQQAQPQALDEWSPVAKSCKRALWD